jgi:hypothetical protein
VPTESKDRQYTIHVGESSAPIEDRSNETVNQSKYGDGTTHCSTYCCIPSHMAVMGTRYAVRGVFSWTTNRDGAEIFYPNSEGIDVAEHELFFVCKLFKTMHVLHLDVLTYTKSRTRSALFDGQPDQLQRILGNDSNDLLYFTEDGGRDPGIHCRNEVGQVFTLVESPTNVTITFDLTANFTLTEISADRTSADSEAANADLAYLAEAYICLDDNSEVANPTALEQGSLL